jgi:hypothetical protein
MLSAAVGAQVPVTAFRGSPIAYSTVPLTAGFIGPAIGPSDLFLFKGGGTVPGAVILEVASLKVSESAKFGQFDMLDFSCVSADSFVKVDNLGVRIRKGSEKLKYVL